MASLVITNDTYTSTMPTRLHIDECVQLGTLFLSTQEHLLRSIRRLNSIKIEICLPLSIQCLLLTQDHFLGTEDLAPFIGLNISIQAVDSHGEALGEPFLVPIVNIDASSNPLRFLLCLEVPSDLPEACSYRITIPALPLTIPFNLYTARCPKKCPDPCACPLPVTKTTQLINHFCFCVKASTSFW